MVDIGCTKTFLQEMRIRTEASSVVVPVFTTFLLCLHDMEERELSAVFRSAAQHFQSGGNPANLFWVGKRDVPGSWVDTGNVAHVNTFVAILQFEEAMLKTNFTLKTRNWLKKLCLPDQAIDKVARLSRVFTIRECESMDIRFESPLEVDADVRGDFERLREIAQPENEEESRELRQLLGKCTEWMEDNDLPDEFFEMPNDKLIEAITQYSDSGGASASMLTDGLVAIDRNTVQICDASPEDGSTQRPTGPPTKYGPGGLETPALADKPDDADSCDELEHELLAYQAVAPAMSAQQFHQLQRRTHEPAGHLLYKNSVELPVLTVHRPKQRLTNDDVTEILVGQFHRKHGTTEPGGFTDTMLQLAECYREVVDEGRLAQKARVVVILPLLAAAYKELFGRRAASVSTELKDKISRIVLGSKCKHCGTHFVPSDQSLYGSDADGNEVVVGKKAYNTQNFCEPRCEERWQCLRCRCGRPLQMGKYGWLDPKCSMCGVGRPVVNRVQRENILLGADRFSHLHRFYPRF